MSFFEQENYSGGHAFRCVSTKLKVKILKKLIYYIIQFKIKIPDGPLDQQLKRLLEIINFNTLNRFNVLLFFTTINKYHKVALLIEKKTGEIYLTILRVSNILYKDTLLDGTLIEDKYIYAPIIHHNHDTKKEWLCKADLSFEIEDYLEDSNSSHLDEDEDEDEIMTDVIVSTEKESVGKKDADADIIKPLVRVGRSIVDEFTTLEQQTSYSRWKFFVGNIYAHSGNIVDRTKTCYQKMELVNQLIKSEVWIHDSKLDLFQIRNHIVGSYYFPKTKQEQNNSFKNDYTYYHGKLLQIIQRNNRLSEQYKSPHFKAMFEIKKTDLPFVYELWLDSQKSAYGIALIPNSECEHYLVQLFRKMRPPIIVSCIYNHTNEKWTPIEHSYGKNRTNDLVHVKKLEKYKKSTLM